MAITDKDVDKLKQVFATKDDLTSELKKYATKDDLASELKKYATKDDLASELKKYATKDDLARFEIAVDKRFNKLEAKFDERFDSVMTTLDKLAGRFETVIQETRITLGQYRRQEDKLEDHEKRISTLEVSRA